MRSRLCALLLGSLSVLLATPPLHADRVAAGVSLQAIASASAKIWAGRHEEFEAYIRAADIDHFENIPIGVTRPRRAFLKPGGLVQSVAWKVLPPSRRSGYWESYKSEIAAYELDKLLEMQMVPVAVEKQWKGETGAAILWVAPVHPWKQMEARPKPYRWSFEAVRMKMFDNLIGNIDRNAGNMLVDDEWNLILIDHSRAFTGDKSLVVKLQHIDRDLWTRMLALDEATLATALGVWVDQASIRAMLVRRDKMKAAIDKLVKNAGEDAVFVRDRQALREPHPHFEPFAGYECAATRSLGSIAISSGCASMCALTIASARAIASASPFR
jgi:hypothetical protein